MFRNGTPPGGGTVATWWANFRRELGARVYGRGALVSDLTRLSNPIIPPFFASMDAGNDTGRGYEPLDQNFHAYMEGELGLFPILSACDDAIGSYASAVPYGLWRGEDRIEEHPLLDLLADPNPEQGYAQFWYALARQWGATGNVYISCVGKPEQAPWANPQELWVLPSHRTKPIPDKSRRRQGKAEAPVLGYVYDGDGGKQEFLPSQILHIKRPHLRDPIVGLSPNKELESALNLLWNALTSNSKYFKNGAMPGLVLEKDAGVAQDVLKRFMEQTDAALAGVGKRGANLYLTGGWKLNTAAGNSPKDAEFLGLVDLMVKWILAVKGVPPFAIGLLEHANWSNSVEQQRYFYDRAIRPFNQAMFDAMNTHAMVQVWGGDLMLAHDYDGIDALSEDRDAQANRASTLYRNQIAKKNEARAIVGLDPVTPEEGGEDFYAPTAGLAGLFGSPEADADSEDVEDDAASGRLAFRMLLGEARALAADGRKEEARARRWLAAVRRTETFEAATRSKMRGRFRLMRAEVLENLAARANTERLADSPKKGVDPRWGQNLFDASAWVDGVLDALTSTLVATIRAGHEDITEESGSEYVPFDVDRAEVKEFLQQRTARNIRTVAENRLGEVANLVEAAAAEGRTVDELATSLREYFGHDVSWSQRIARTEIHQLYEEGSLLGMKDAGVTTKQWLTARDAFVRDSHREADGQEVPVDGHFIVGGHAGRAPGQFGVPEEDIQCRCTAVAGGF